MTAETVTVGTSTAVQLDSGVNLGNEIVMLRNASGEIHIGGSDVDTTDGFPYSDTDGILTLPVPPSGLYAIAASEQTVKVLRSS